LHGETTLIAKNRPCSASIAHSQGARTRVVSGPSGWPLAFGLRDEHRADSEECNRADWRSTLRYAAAAKRRWKREIVRLPTLRRRVGTPFGTARLVEFALSADDALLFRPVGPFHHRRKTEPMSLMWRHFSHSLNTLDRFSRTCCYAEMRCFSTPQCTQCAHAVATFTRLIRGSGASRCNERASMSMTRSSATRMPRNGA
jgi:hypothetical protein